MKKYLFLFAFFAVPIFTLKSVPDKNIFKVDVIVYGGTSSAVSASVQKGKNIHELSYDEIKTKLESDGQVFNY